MTSITLDSPNLPSGLYLVATPIGNLKDITLRALEVLTSVDLIACEDTRVTKKLLTRFSISTPTTSYNDYNADHKLPDIMAALEKGKAIALVSDAGTPLISDPGYKLVRAAREKNIMATSLPGASAVLTAITLSGLPVDSFTFSGYLPPKEGALRTALEKTIQSDGTQIFFESPKRLVKTLKMLADLNPEARVCVARELTKLYEEVRIGRPEDVLNHYEALPQVKGEIVLLVTPTVQEDQDWRTILKDRLKDVQVKQAVEEIASAYGIRKKDVYTQALEFKGVKK